MEKTKRLGFGDELFGTRLGELRDAVGPVKGEFVTPPDVPDVDERADALPEQEEFWRAPVRFGSIPVESTPLGWDPRRGFRKLYPQVMLPTQVVERVSFGHAELEPNRLFWGDNLHVIRQLPSESVDLIYIDPPFFSGKQYNIIFGDQNELRSFSDIWEAGLPGYLIWLNARLYEMKRLLRKSGSIYVHLDWHASHYVKQEMDKVFGYESFVNEVIWRRANNKRATRKISVVHDTLLLYAKSKEYYYKELFHQHREEYVAEKYTYEENGRRYRLQSMYGKGTGPSMRFGERLIAPPPGLHWRWDQDRIDEAMKERIIVFPKGGQGMPCFKDFLDTKNGIPLQTIWNDIPDVNSQARERIGYPTQKPEALVRRIIEASCQPGGTVADFFCGGGTLPVVAQRLGRRWVACDQSRVAVAITADRLARTVEQMPLEAKTFAVPDFTVEHWGIYEAKRLAETPPDQFREFVLRAFGAVPDTSQPGIHGHKGAIPVWVGQPAQTSQVTAQDVADFSNAVRRTVRYQQDNLRDGIMLAWAFRPDAVQAAERLRQQEATDLNFIRLDLIRVDSPRFREHVQALSTDKADYSTFLTFVQPPRVGVGWKKLSGLTYRFDVSETVVLNVGAKIINVQWDFDYRQRFTSTQGYSFVHTAKREPALQVDYTFPAYGRHRIACKVQDDAGGEGLWVGEAEVK